MSTTHYITAICLKSLYCIMSVIFPNLEKKLQFSWTIVTGNKMGRNFPESFAFVFEVWEHPVKVLDYTKLFSTSVASVWSSTCNRENRLRIAFKIYLQRITKMRYMLFVSPFQQEKITTDSNKYVAIIWDYLYIPVKNRLTKWCSG